MFSDKEIFLADYKKLKKILELRSQEATMDAPVILRKILLDGTPLLHKVNKEYRLDVKFKINERMPIPDNILNIKGQLLHIDRTFDPESGVNLPLKEVNLKEFLREIAIPMKEVNFTFKDLISYLANIAGGVHKSKAKNKSQEALEQMTKININIFDMYPRDMVLSTFYSIVKITTNAIEPLAKKIEEELTAQKLG